MLPKWQQRLCSKDFDQSRGFVRPPGGAVPHSVTGRRSHRGRGMSPHGQIPLQGRIVVIVQRGSHKTCEHRCLDNEHR